MTIFRHKQNDSYLSHNSLVRRVLSKIEGHVVRRREPVSVGLASAFVLTLTAWVCFRLGFDGSMVKCLFLIPIVFLSMVNGIVVSIALCVTVILSIDFLFTEPRFTFHLLHDANLMSMTTFFASSLSVAMLVRHLRELVKKERKQAQLLELTHDSVIVRDMEDTIVDWNKGAELVYGWKKHEVLGKISHDVLCTRFPIPLAEIMHTLMRSGRWEGELVQAKRDGTELVLSTRWLMQRDEHGKPIATFESGNDITARKRAEDALWRNQATYLAEAQKLSRTGSFGWNLSTGDIFWSDQTFFIFGYDSSVVPNIPLILQRVHPDDRERVQRTIEQATSIRGELNLEHRLMMPDKSIKHLRVVAHAAIDNPSRNQFPGAIQYAGAVMDVTEAKRAQEQLQATQNELTRVTRVTTLGELTASIAHEVGQPLTAIAISSETCLRWLERTPPRTEEARQSLMRIINDSQRAADIVRRVRTLTKKESVQMARLNLNDVINDVIPLIQREILDHQISIRLHLSPKLPPSIGDRVQLQQVLVNLLLNAIQAMAAVNTRPRNISIESNLDEEGNVIVAVRDCGTGISTEIASRLFDSFFTTKPQGMGMGLSICRSIVEAHGGKIWAIGNTGHGAIFQFELPRMTESPRDNHFAARGPSMSELPLGS